ncbi:MAG: phenylalanine--tRNA ligase subunit beta [Bacillota bacterium]
MRVSYNWLQEYINLTLSPAELAERLTLAGVEVESLEPFRGSLPRVVAGLVKAVEPLQDSDKLTRVRVDAGGSLLNVVCGAPNVAAGQLVPLALPGAALPGGLRIEASRIFGVVSEGMLCSARELGLELAEAAAGLLVLDEPASPGTPIEKLLGFDDQILVLGLTPNRADCLSMLGVAYEVAALTGAAVKIPSEEPPEVADAVAGAARINVLEPVLCPRYTARVMRGVSIGAAPLWMQLRLLKAGIRPINNIVDITNYVMWELGQPLHAFDYQLLQEGEIIVRRAASGETLLTLDGVERALDRDVLVIADRGGPIGLAGVMGGENTEISPGTTTVLLEAALFNPVNIRRTARRFNLPSEASQRFERGINPEATMAAQNRAASLMARLAGAAVLRGVLDYDPDPPRPRRIIVRPYRINEILGVKIPVGEVTAILERLGCTVEQGGGRSLEVTVPARRGDVAIEEDVVEEVARLYGYDKIPVTLPRGELVEAREAPERRVEAVIRDTLTACGFFEVITYSFINAAELDRLGLAEDDSRRQAIAVQNPLSEEQGIMRTTMLPGILKVLQHNFNYQETDQLLYEIGTIFMPRRLPLDELPDERNRLVLAATGRVPGPHWAAPGLDAGFFLLKGVLETLLARLCLNVADFEPVALKYTHPTRSALIRSGGEEIGYLGQLHPKTAEAWGFRQPVIIGELDLDRVIARANLVPRVTPLSRYPAALRDLALIVPRDIPAGSLQRAMREAGGALVDRITLFDLYEGEQIPAGRRSLAFTIAFRRPGGTLTDEEVNAVLARIEQALAGLGASIRRR